MVIMEESKPPGDIHSKNSSRNSRRNRALLDLGQHLSDQAPETTGLFIHLHLTETADEQGRYCHL